MKNGFIGLGNMGSAMAANLVKAGFSVTVWNRTYQKSIALAEIGAAVTGSPRAVAEVSDNIIAMMSNTEAVKSVRDKGVTWNDCKITCFKKETE